MPPTAQDFQKELNKIFQEAQWQGKHPAVEEQLWSSAISYPDDHENLVDCV